MGAVYSVHKRVEFAEPAPVSRHDHSLCLSHRSHGLDAATDVERA